MEKKYFEEFMKIFMHLKNAALILSGDFYSPRKEQEIIEIEQIVNQLAEINSVLFKNLFDEIEQNLYNHPESREIYLAKILRAFIDIAPYLNIDVVKEYCIDFGKQSIKIGDKTYPYSVDILHKMLIMREAWRNHGWDEIPITIPEKYAILCFRVFMGFFNQLNAIFLSFNIDLMEIQNKQKLRIWEREISILDRLDYSSEILKDVKIESLQDNHLPLKTKEIEKPELPERLELLFDSISKYKAVLEILVSKGFIQPNTYIWKDVKKGNKAFLAALLKDLHGKMYYKENVRLTSWQIQAICKNTFGWEIGIDTIKHAKANNFDFEFIPPASTIS